jgi:hypothetical protein
VPFAAGFCRDLLLVQNPGDLEETVSFINQGKNLLDYFSLKIDRNAFLILFIGCARV